MARSFAIVVTDVTIYGKLRCVAGWDVKQKVMVRPEPGPGQFWPAYVCGQNTTFHPGHLVTFRAAKPMTLFPHQTEDWVVEGEPTRLGVATAEEFKNVLAESLAVQPSNAFGMMMRTYGTTAYVLEGANCSSLCAGRVSREKLKLTKKTDGEWEKPRAKLNLGHGELDLSIAAKDLRQAFDLGGLDAIREKIDGPNLHVRFGLARAVAHSSGERRCYLQINGIYPD